MKQAVLSASRVKGMESKGKQRKLPPRIVASEDIQLSKPDRKFANRGLENWNQPKIQPEIVILDAEQKNRGLWELLHAIEAIWEPAICAASQPVHDGVQTLKLHDSISIPAGLTSLKKRRLGV